MISSRLRRSLGVGARLGVVGSLAIAALALGLQSPASAYAVDGVGAREAVSALPQAAANLRLGSRGAAVRAVQSTLARLAYLPANAVDGIFGMRTWHAVVAFQGWSYLPRDGIVGPRTRSALSRGQRPTPWSTASGFEIHTTQQVLLLVANGRVLRAIHVSTGARGATPLGHFRIYRRDPMSWSVPFHVWMPLAQYFSGGYAMHEFADVPAYPASHGCVRVPHPEAQTVWQFGRVGMRVWTRG